MKNQFEKNKYVFAFLIIMIFASSCKKTYIVNDTTHEVYIVTSKKLDKVLQSLPDNKINHCSFWRDIKSNWIELKDDTPESKELKLIVDDYMSESCNLVADVCSDYYTDMTLDLKVVETANNQASIAFQKEIEEHNISQKKLHELYMKKYKKQSEKLNLAIKKIKTKTSPPKKLSDGSYETYFTIKNNTKYPLKCRRDFVGPIWRTGYDDWRVIAPRKKKAFYMMDNSNPNFRMITLSGVTYYVVECEVSSAQLQEVGFEKTKPLRLYFSPVSGKYIKTSNYPAYDPPLKKPPYNIITKVNYPAKDTWVNQCVDNDGIPPVTNPYEKVRVDQLVAAGQQWNGSYSCGTSRTILNLFITSVSKSLVSDDYYNIRAVFYFGNSRYQGVYYMDGEFYPNGKKITLHPLDWINQPQGYHMVGMDGSLFEGRYGKRDVFLGKITAPGCDGFRLKLKSK